MNLLALELATEACSIALQSGDRTVNRHAVAPRQHAELALAWTDELLDELNLRKADLDAVAISVGPGAFTGVRLAIAMGQGIALGLQKPLVGVSTLAVLAMEAVSGGYAGNILAVIDARMGEVYAGRFRWDGQHLTALGAETVIAPSELDLDGIGPDWRAVGTGINAADGTLRQRLNCTLFADALPNALNLLRLAADAVPQSPENVEPTYLRNNVALTLVEQQALRDAKKK